MRPDPENLSGRLRDRVVLTDQPRPQSVNELGEPIPADVVTSAVWAEVVPLSGRELQLAQQTAGEQLWRITIRWRPGVTERMKVLYGTRTLNINAPPKDPDGKRVSLILTCAEQQKG